MGETNWLLLENRIRATPLDLLRQGVSQRSWAAIDIAYTMLTGEIPKCRYTTITDSTKTLEEIAKSNSENIEIKVKRQRGRPKKNSIKSDGTGNCPEVLVNPIQPSDISNVATAIIPNVYGLPSECVAPSKSSANPVTDRRKGGFIPHDMQPHNNTWTDTKSEAANEIVPAADRHIPQEVLNAQRPPVNNIKVKCTSCGQTKEVDPTLAPNGYRLTKKYAMKWKCNDCCVGAKSGIDDDMAAGDDDELIDEDME